MAGIYIHFPFCRQKCNYCNFFSLATRKFRDEFLRALLNEIDLTRDYLGNEPVETIYFGGGTPSLFDVNNLEEIIQKIWDAGYMIPDPGSRIRDPGSIEITLEMNPDDVTQAYLEALSSSAINRISLGVQSFFDEDLAYLSRIHDAKQAVRAIEQIREMRYAIPDKGRGKREAGRGKRKEGRGTETGNQNVEIVNLSIDLIYGIPTLTNEHWKENLSQVIDLGIPHLSAYALTVEPKTPLAWQIEKAMRHEAPAIQHPGSGIRDPESGIRQPVSDDQVADQFEILMEVMERAGYIQYEISNFCLSGYESSHNSNYWRGVPYLGLGPSAHSFNGTSRRWNSSNLTSYIWDLQSERNANRRSQSGILPVEEEILTPVQQYNEYVMTSLRTIWGCDLSVIEKRFGKAYAGYFSCQADKHLRQCEDSGTSGAVAVESGGLQESGGIYTLTRKGKLLADRIAAELFLAE